MSTKFCKNCKHVTTTEIYNYFTKRVNITYRCKHPTVREGTKEYLVDGYGLEMLCINARTDPPMEGPVINLFSACGSNGNLYEVK